MKEVKKCWQARNQEIYFFREIDPYFKGSPLKYQFSCKGYFDFILSYFLQYNLAFSYSIKIASVYCSKVWLAKIMNKFEISHKDVILHMILPHFCSNLNTFSDINSDLHLFFYFFIFLFFLF